MNIPSVKLH